MLSGMIPHEAIELMVVKVYTSTVSSESTDSSNKVSSVDAPPATVLAGFLKFLSLLATHNWAREPLIVDPQNHINADDRGLIRSQFDTARGPNEDLGPAMYLVSPSDYDGIEDGMSGATVVGADTNAKPVAGTEKVWTPSITASQPEKVVLLRAAALARCSRDHLTTCLVRGGSSRGSAWAAAFHESPASLTSYSALLRVDSSFVIDPGCSSTTADVSMSDSVSPFERSIQKLFSGPKALRKKHYKNLVLEKDTLHVWHPVKSLVNLLRQKFKHYAVFFYNELTPEIIAVVWRPQAFQADAFSAMLSASKRPSIDNWKDDSLVVTNTDDIIFEIGCVCKNIVVDMKILDTK